jgi:hypothetical protein
MEGFLKYYGVEFKRDGNKYHVHIPPLGCPVAGRMHKDDANKDRAVSQSTFIWTPGEAPGFECQSGGCEGKRFKDAHSALIKRTNKKTFQVWERPKKRLVDMCLDAVKVKERRYLWPPFLESGCLVHFMGLSGQGKSPVTVDIAARTTTGANWPDGAVNEYGPCSVIMLCMEDDLESVIKPRFLLAGGDSKKCHVIRATKIENWNTCTDYERQVALDQDMEELIELADSIDDLKLIVIDPITNYLGSKKMNSDEEVRQVLTPLAMLAQRRELTVVNVGHKNKREGTNPWHRALGASAFGSVARELYSFGDDPNANDKYHHVFVPNRIQANPGMCFSTYEVEQTFDGVKLKVVGIHWHGHSTVEAVDLEEVLGPQRANKEAAKLLADYLSKGPESVKACKNFLAEQGFPDVTVRLVCQYAGVESEKSGKVWMWRLKPNKVEPDDTKFEPDMFEEENKQ